MERIAEKRHEPEPVLFDRLTEACQLATVQEAQKTALLPRVLKPADAPWTMGMQAFHRTWVGHMLGDRLARAPICTMGILEQILEPGTKGGRHRHVNEAIFYVIEGEGYEIHDGKRWDWSAGDIMTVPSYCDHQHFNSDQRQKARMWYSVSPVIAFMGVWWVEQIEMKAGYTIPEDGKPIYGPDKQVIGYRTKDGKDFKLGFDQNIQKRITSRIDNLIHIEKPRDEYEQYIKLTEEEITWRQSTPHVVRSKEIAWENTRMGRIKFLVTPRRNCGLKIYDAFMQELPPGGSSGKHRHAAEEVHKILQGTGYDVHDGVRHDWEAEDVVCIPPYVTHQHFNSDTNHPARFVAYMSRWYAFIGHGGIEHLEDAPTNRDSAGFKV